MNTKFIVLMTLLIVATCDTTVNKADVCNACTQFKSQADCTNYGGCTWTMGSGTTAGSCAKTVAVSFTAYCPGLANPATSCASTNGCAYLDSKCTHFAGCSAYVKTTTSDCQAISISCISDGTTCIDASTCDKYSATQCASTPDLNGRKCTLDSTTNTCRNYTCLEAEASLNTDEACNKFSEGCVTSQAGCVAPKLPSCSGLTGTETTCLLMRGNDGKCKFNSGTSCTVKLCSDALTSTSTDADCKTFQDGCVTTGKGCIASLGLCQSYTVTNAATDCTGYIGSDGVCEGDTGQTTCRKRKCENSNGTTLPVCQEYQKDCKTNGKQCVTTLGKCESYSGTISQCTGILASDGNCTGTSATVSGPCKLKDCVTDSQDSYNTDELCKRNIQSWCYSTGKGCVAQLPSCTQISSTLTDGSDCLTRTGSEGKCKAGTGSKCAAKSCSDAPPTTTSNSACNTFKTGCVTTGAGCISPAQCINTVKQITCQGTQENSTFCNWNQICVDYTACSSLPTQAICAAYKSKVPKQCIWDITQKSCRNAVCKDYTAITDSACNTLLTGCVTNGTICADPKICSQFSGATATCEAFTASCTNTSAAIASTPCIDKTCDNAAKSLKTDPDCSGYLTTCVTNGAGCIDNTATCSQYLGLQSDCANFTGYVDQNTRIKCWSLTTTGTASNCVSIQCSLASGMTGDTDCGSFLPGCIFDGGSSCVTASASCSSYKGDATTCPNFKGSDGTKFCWYSSGSYCTNKLCSHAAATLKTNEACGDFLTGCVTNGAGCVDPTLTACSSYSGTKLQCDTYSYVPSASNIDKCTRLEACTTKTCTDKTGVTNNKDCLDYHQSCRLKQGTTTCQPEQASCISYNSFASGATDSDKQTYCNSITIDDNKTLCAYDPTQTSKCAARTCALWLNTLTNETCVNYVSVGGCRLATNGVCYEPDTCDTYGIPSTVTQAADKLAWCKNMQDDSDTPLQCTWTTGTKCEAISSCELIASPTSAADCNIYLSGVDCQFVNSKCIKTVNACTGYSLSGIATGQAAYCSALKADNSGVVTPCKYDSGTTGTCVAKTCADVTSPTSQASCDNVLSGCKYYNSSCITIVACTGYSVPVSYSAAEKQLFCQNMYEVGTTNFCSYGSGACAATKSTCADYSTLPTGSELAFCKSVRISNGQMCTRANTDTACSDPADVCALITTGATSDSYCDLYTTPKICVAASPSTVGGGACAVRAPACDSKAATGSDDAAKLTFCQTVLNPSGLYCSFVSGASCAAPKANCAAWNGLTPLTSDHTAVCRARIAQDGTPCAYDQGSATCRARKLCEDASSPQSQADCDQISSGCTYSYSNKKCYLKNAACNTYLAVGADDTLKKAYCSGLVNSGSPNVKCTLINGATTCTEVIANCTYAVTSGDGFATNLAKCQALGCTYYTGNTCIAVTACGSYTGGTNSNCSSLKNTTGKICIAASGATDCAAPANCEAIQTTATPASQSDCDKYLSGCVYFSSKCYTVSGCTSYTPGGSAISVCAALKDSTTKQFCKASADGDTNCAARLCSDVIYPTHAQCQTYMTTCISDGTKCIDASTTCAAQKGTPEYCQWALDQDGVSTCTNAAAKTDSAACVSRTCEQNVVATSDPDCAAFQTGCVTRGLGCISNTALCNKYYGTVTECQNFVGGTDGKCWGSSTYGPCRARLCSDNTSATQDGDCANFLSGCVTNGQGCISSSAQCSAYKGQQATCKAFKGSDGKCWNTTSAAATAPCVSRVCTQLAGTTNDECSEFLSSCVTNGKSCVPNTTNCSGFKGTYVTCKNFKAADGPCKSANYSTTESACTPRICTEAPNNLATDKDCTDYHPLCRTTGKGCIASSSINCGYIQTSTACAARPGCLWANQCRASPTVCSSMTSQGQSICTNTPLTDGTKCAWNNNQCVKFACTDYDATLNTHAACNADPLCTTSGAGCVLLGNCVSYTTPSICNAANTTEDSVRCTWDDATAKCRPRICTDNTTSTSDQDCGTYLTGCRTSGNGCVGPTFKCDVFTSQKLCLYDGNKNPCLWVNGICYNYADCTDATSSSLIGCQAFNALCVPGATTCIAQTSCASYTSLQSCTVGINNTVCGWLPTGKCSVFGACSDAIGTSNQDCLNYSPTCLTDGTKCVAIGTCSSYLTQTACGNAGTDGQCNWVASSSSCRLAVCTDKTATTDAECLSFIVASGKCTTDGTTCVARAACTSYQTQTACTFGSDGIPCIYTYAVGQTTGTQSCRAKECSDITGTSNDQCLGQIAGKNCVSNGKTCVKQDTCANYKNKISCNGGGSDGVCAFTPAATTADPLAGTCVQFSSCDKANKDQAACNSKSGACQWTSTVSGTTTTTSCAAKNCVQAASGSSCNYIPSFDGTKYTICNLVNNVCTASDPSTLAQSTCYSKSAYTYTWNESTSKCVSCNGSTTTPTNNSTGGNTTNQTNTTTDTNGYILGVTIPLAILGLFA